MDNHKARTFDFGAFHMNVEEHRLLRGGEVVPLTPKNFDVLRMLVANAGHLVTKEELLTKIWADSFVEEANLNRSISVLRKALGDGTDGLVYIETVPKRGYRFVAKVRADATAEVTLIPPTETALRPPSRRFLLGVVAGISLCAVVMTGLLIPSGRGNIVSPVHRKLTASGKVNSPAISPDGNWIAYVSYDSPERKLMVQDRSSTVATAVFAAPEVGRLRWSPNGSEILFRARVDGKDGLYIVPHAGGNARKVFSILATACWSPDGKTLAVVPMLSGKIQFLDSLGNNRGSIPLEGVKRWVFDLDWSPITDLLLFVHDDHQGKRMLSTIRRDGTSQQKVLDGFPGISAARWAPNGDAVYFMSQQNQTASLYKLPLKIVAGTRPVPEALLTGLETDATFGVSRDGKYMVYARAPFSSNLWSVRLDDAGGRPAIETQQITQGTSLVERPSISPDGKNVVYSSGSPSALNLYIVPIEGGTPKQLTFRESLNLGGVWAPGGQLIAFASNEGGVAQIWMARTDGGPPRRVSEEDVSDNYSLSWSPGFHLLYQRSGNQNFHVVDPQAGKNRLLLEDNRGGWTFNPVYSPDGKKIAIAWSAKRKVGLYVLEANKPERFVIGGAMPMLIGWAADGNSVFALDGKSASSRGNFTPTGETTTEARIIRYPLDGSPAQTVAELPFEEIGGVSISPDGRTLVCVVYVSSSDVWISENFDHTRERTVW